MRTGVYLVIGDKQKKTKTMNSLTAIARKSLNALYELCTGRSEYVPLDEEHYRQRILVMTNAFWMGLVILLTVIVPFLVDLRPEGVVAADLLLLATATAVASSMMILRSTGKRIVAVNFMLIIISVAFGAACFAFGGTQSPTYHLMIMAPVLAGIVGSMALSLGWSAGVLTFWVAIMLAEKNGVQFLQIIAPANHSLAMMLSYAASAVAVLSVIIIYAEMNKALREDLQESNIELEHLSSHDQLTLLPNRRFYEERIALALQRAADRSSMVGLLMIDLNGFKKINDTYGHGAGDKLLTTVAERIQDNLRETDLVARMGGDEFVAVLEDMKSADQITRIAHKLEQAIEQPVSIRQQPLSFGASIGVSIFPVDGRQQHELEEKADKAMYLAKKRGIGVALSSLEDTDQPIPVKPRLHQV